MSEVIPFMIWHPDEAFVTEVCLPPGWKPISTQSEWEIAADYWEENGKTHPARWCRELAQGKALSFPGESFATLFARTPNVSPVAWQCLTMLLGSAWLGMLD